MQLFIELDVIFPQSGLYEQWAAALTRETKLKSRQRQARKNVDEQAEQGNEGPRGLTIKHMQGAFMLLLLGLVLATLAFVGETLHTPAKTNDGITLRDVGGK